MSRDSQDDTDWGAITRYGVLLVLLLAGAGYWKWNESKKPAGTASTAPSRPLNNTGGQKSAQKSISSLGKLAIGEKAVTADEVRPLVQAWVEKAYQVDGLTPQPAQLSKEQWQPFARACVWEECGDPRKLSRLELVSLARDLAPVAKAHPVSAFLVGMALTGEPGSLQLLETAAKGLSETAGSETLAFHAAAGLALATAYEQGQDAAKNRVETAIQALRKALDAEDGYAKQHDRVIAYLLMSGHVGSFFGAVHERMAQEVTKTPSVKPWVKKWIEGQHCLQEAWDSRGGGYSNTVSDDGSAIFKHESEKARRLLQEAWELNPEDPSPAVSLIYSSLSMGKREAPAHMRQWFNEVLQKQVDEPTAAHNVLWGLRPRWYGSHREMQDLGLACAETGRFDSALPWVLLQAHRDCASEWDVPDAYFKELNTGSYNSLRAVFEGAEAESKRASWRSVDRTHSAVLEFKCAHYEEAQKWLEKLEFKPNRTVMEDWSDVDTDLLLGKTAAFARAGAGDLLRRAESAEHSFQSGVASSLYGEALGAAKDKISEAGRKYLESRLAITDIEKQLAEGKSTSLMPDADFRSWSRHGGGWKAEQNTLRHWGRGQISASACQARIGSGFTAEGEIEVTEPGDACQVWLSYGYPDTPQKDRWIAVRFAYGQGKTAALLSNGMGQPMEHPEIKVQPRFRFRLVASPSGISLYVDDVAAFENVPVPSHYVKERWGQLGLGAATKSDQTRVKVHSLLVKQ